MSNDEPSSEPSPLTPGNEPLTPDPTLTGPPPTPNPLEHRFTPEDAPYPWAVGRSTREVMQLLQQMNVAMQTGGPSPTLAQPQAQFAQPQPYTAPVPPPEPPSQVNSPDVNLAIREPEEYNRQLAAYLEARDQRAQQAVLAQVQQLAGPLMRNNAMMARSNVATDKEYNYVFERYGPEIDLLLETNGVPVQQRTIEAFQMAADVIRGRHYKELAQHEAQALLANAGVQTGTVHGGTMPSGSAGASGDALDHLWETEHDYVKSAKGNKLTKRDIREAIKKQGHTVDAFVKLLDNNHMFIAPDGKHITTRSVGNE